MISEMSDGPVLAVDFFYVYMCVIVNTVEGNTSETEYFERGVSETEIMVTIKILSSGKAPGVDSC